MTFEPRTLFVPSKNGSRKRRSYGQISHAYTLPTTESTPFRTDPSLLPPRPASTFDASARDISDLGELNHDFAFMGVRSRQKPGAYTINQRCKAPIILAYMMMAIAKCRRVADDAVTFADLFCADGFYTMAAKHLGAASCLGIDNDRDGFLHYAKVVAARLGFDGVEFVREDVENIEKFPKADVVANLGGLYHVSNPEDILQKSYAMARHYLIVQTVVSLAETDPEYFEAPAPGWTWGSRHSHASFDKLVERLGYEVVDRHFNELEGNGRPEDRGSVYYLIRVNS
jgi:hypothetical protein